MHARGKSVEIALFFTVAAAGLGRVVLERIVERLLRDDVLER
jgi:hypothetical protein